MSQPLDERPAIPPAMLHRISDPAQIFNGDDGVPPHMGEIGYLLRGENRQLPLLPGCGLAVKLRLIQRRHARLPIKQQRHCFSFEVAYLLLRRADRVPERVNPLGERRLIHYPPRLHLARHNGSVVVYPHIHTDGIVTGKLDNRIIRHDGENKNRLAALNLNNR